MKLYRVSYITGQQQITNTALTQDRKAIQSETLSYKTNTDSAELPWKVNQYTYDDQGRVTSHQVSWAKGADVPTGSIPSSQVRYDYAYLDSGNGGHHKLQTTKTDALGNKTTEVHLLDLPNQPLQKQTDALGHSVSYEYNALGLKTKATDAEGHAKTTVYQTLDQAGMNSVTQTDPGGYAVQKIVDGLGREIEQRDNGDPTAGGSKVSRVLQTTTYNAIGKPASQTDRLGLKTTMQYDSLGRVTVQKDPLGNVVETTYEPAKLKATTKENGVIRAVQWVDVFNQEVQKDLYSDSDDHNIDYIKRIKKAYNAGGKEIDNQSITVDKADPQKTHLLGEIKYQYNIEGKKAGIFFKGDDDISLDRHVQYDLLGNQLTYDKTTHYPGGQSYTQHGDIQHYDATGQLLSREHRDEANPKTVLWQEQYAYDAAGNMIRKTRPDGTIINYQYSPNGNKTEMSWPTGKIQYQYDATGQLTSESDGQQTLRYDYTLDGQQKQTTYPDQKTLRIEFDQYSRPIKVTDASGAVKTLSYTPQNLLEQVQYQGDHLTNHYGLDHHHNGVLTGFDLKGQQTLKESFSYNGFNLLDNQDVEDGQGNHIQTTYGYNPIGDVVRVEDVGRWSVAEPPLQRVKQYGYDSLDQLRQSTSTSTVAPGEQQTKQVRYTLDGNSNVIETADSQNNQPEKVTHSQYNALDQLQKPGLVFDKNGRITKTADGKTYRYNALDQLLTVTDSAGKELVSYGYYPNGILGKRTTPQGTETFYQKDDKDHNEQVNAIYDNTHQSWTTYLQVNGQRLASYQTK